MDTVRDAMTFAREAAEGVPQELRTAAFAEVLRWRLEGIARPNSHSQRRSRTRPESEDRGKARPTIPPVDVVSEKGDRGQQIVWAVMRLEEKGAEAVNDSIREVIAAELSVTPQTRMDTNRTLRRLTPRYLRREKRSDGKGYRYMATANAARLFDHLEE